MNKKIIKTALIITIMMIVAIYNPSYGTEINNKKESIKIASATNSTTIENTEETNADLKALSINGYTIYPEFNKNTTEYFVAVPLDVTSLEVEATTESDMSTAKITGNTNITRSEHSIKVVVTSKKRVTKTYTINVTKQEENSLKLKELSIEGAELDPSFSETNYFYSAEIEQFNEVKPLNINAVAADEDTEIEIIGNDDTLLEGNNIITITLRNGEETSVYQIEATIVLKESIIEPANNVSKFILNAKENIKTFFEDENKTIATLAGVAALLMLLIMIIKIVKHNSAEKSRNKIKRRAK